MVQKEMSFKDISIKSSDNPCAQQTQTICAILVEGIMRNKAVKLFAEFGLVVQRNDV